MFTWICPQCGREVPPAYTECPDCKDKAAKGDQAAAAPPQPPQAAPPYSQAPPQTQAQYPAPYQPAPPAQPQYQQPYPPQYQQPPMRPPRAPLPTWLMAALFALAFVGLGSGVYWLVGAGKGTSAKPAAAVESPAAKPGAKVSPFQKYIEISGVRFVEDPKKKTTTNVQFVVTNHSGADIPELGGNVTVWGRTRNSEEDAAGTFTFKSDLKAYESKEMSAPLTTKLRIYELPDWQNISTDIQITSPSGQ
jgi:hypothetical protein